MTGEEFRQARLNRKLTQRQLGERLGYQGRTAERMVQSWEYGDRKIPLRYFRKLAEILQIPLDRFIP